MLYPRQYLIQYPHNRDGLVLGALLEAAQNEPMG